MAVNNTKNKGAWVPLLVLTALAVGLSYAMLQWVGEDQSEQATQKSRSYQRIVSLTPAITSTFVSLGAGDKLVGISDYCAEAPQVSHAKRVGSGLTPNYEGIVKLRPDLIVLETTKQGDYKKLEAISETRILPWLTLDEVATGIRGLGGLAEKSHAADAIASNLTQVLGEQENLNGPRVLLLMGLSSFDGGSLWFIKRNSLHGAALKAVGARNAVDHDVSGAPSMSMEELLKVDPDVIINLVSQSTLSESDREIHLKRMSEFGVLKAVQSNKVGFVVGKQYLGTGPEILDLVAALKLELERLMGDT